MTTPTPCQLHDSQPELTAEDFAEARQFLESWGCMVYPIPQIIDMAERASRQRAERNAVLDEVIAYVSKHYDGITASFMATDLRAMKEQQ